MRDLSFQITQSHIKSIHFHFTRSRKTFIMSDIENTPEDFTNLLKKIVHLSKLSLSGQTDDLRLYIDRLSKQCKAIHPLIAKELEHILKITPKRDSSILRDNKFNDDMFPLPVDRDSRMSLLKIFKDDSNFEKPFLSKKTSTSIDQLVEERKNSKGLLKFGLSPARTAIFTGPPGVGKTLTARWLSTQLQLPLLTLDLSTVMSSYLGKTGNNLRAVLDFAKKTPSILFLDEIDSIAKKRTDESDVGELKRLVTVMLQEIDEWPVSGLLIAATNHDKLIDPALWRRFDMIIPFEIPDQSQTKHFIENLLKNDHTELHNWIPIFNLFCLGLSYSDIERLINRIRKHIILEKKSLSYEKIIMLIEDNNINLERKTKYELLDLLLEKGELSQRQISSLLGVARETIRSRSQKKHK